MGNPPDLTRLYALYVTDLVGFLKRGFTFNAEGRRLAFRGYKEPWHLENAVQEVFIKVFSENARNGYDGVRPFRNYLFRIAKNSVMDEFRRKRTDILSVEDAVVADDQPLDTESAPASQEQSMIDKQLKEQLDGFIAHLRPDDRALFELRFVQGECVETCAQKLRWSEYRVKRDEKRIRRQFFDRLKANGYFEGTSYKDPSVRALTVLLLTALCRGGIC